MTVQFRGREVSHAYIGRDLLDRFAASVADYGNVDRPPILEGRSMTMVLTASLKPAAQVRKPDGETKAEDGSKPDTEPKSDAEPKTPRKPDAAPAAVVPPVVAAGSDAPAAASTGG